MTFNTNNSMARIIAFQRNELLTKLQSRIRKIFGRFLFTSLFSRFLNKDHIASKYYKISVKEYIFLKKFINTKCNNILSIGGGLGGVESLVLSNFQKIKLDLIDRNFVSKKIKYHFNPKEAYNSSSLTEKFISNNSNNYKNFKFFDFDKKIFPKKKYDIIFSFFSLDYHYDFNVYKKFLIKSSNKKTLFIFDTIRPSYFKKIFKYIKIINNNKSNIHRSKRLVCREIMP